MSLARKLVVATTILVGVVAGAWAQFGGGAQEQPPEMPIKWFNAVPGSGAQYDVTRPGRTKVASVSYVILSKESVEGKDGYWVEIRMEGLDPKMSGESVIKTLMVIEGGKQETKRVIMQAGGMPPMEIPQGLMAMGAAAAKSSPKAAGQPEKVGSETVTVPAGTYECDHYRLVLGGKPADIWISPKAPAYGVVKQTSPGMNMELKTILSNETSHIKGEPQAMPSFPH